MSTKQHNSEEEVDLGSLFQVIGKGFSRFLNFVVSIFKGIFHFLIIVLLFFRKHAIIIIISGVVLGAVGYFLDSSKTIIYESKMLVKPNFNSTKQLYSNIKFYNDLVGQEEYELLTGTFNISDEEARSLRGFSIKPIKNENDIVSGYNELLASVDTISLRNYKITEFKEAFTNHDYKVHEIKVRSTQNKIFTKFDAAILSSIINNEYFKKLKESENTNLDRSYNLYQKNLKDADTLRKVYMKALLDEAKKPTQGTSIDMGSRGNQNNEIQLFSISRNLNSNLSKINEDKAHKTEIVNVISSFQKIGSKEQGLLKNKMLVLGAIGILGTILVLLLKELNGFLNNYKK
ncbi:hypothetical protein RQM59_01990 [Flavobacteriaceae bacterium S356]|uniref:Polysaccharide chain length determinant N-terminal domain-containing protein n=1 Tax=Asprobacillus argus TaxID=3076534 RepID=A0ABU3LD60_9FLAO|nr:hypothetical protein [Flavobacteriaceae bacterium S356]